MVGRSRTGPSSLQCSFDQARTLFIWADIRKGWRERRTTHGFVGQDLVPALNGHTARLQLAVLATSPHYEPRLTAAEGRDRGIHCRVDAQRIELVIDLFDENGLFNPELGWTETKNGKPMVFRDASPSPLREQRNSPSDPFIGYLFKLWLIIQPPERKPAPIYLEWSRRFFPGGLPSLGRRHS